MGTIIGVGILFLLGPMVGTFASRSPEQKDRFDRYKEDDDNIKDIKSDLSVLKKNINLNTKVDSVDTKMDEKEYTWENFINDLDREAEEIFDNYIEKNEEKIKELIKNGDMTTLTNMFNTEIWENIDAGFTLFKNVLEKAGIITKEIVRPFTFELNALKEDIQQELGLSGDKGLHNVFEDLPGKGESDVGSQKEIQEQLHNTPDYIDGYPSGQQYNPGNDAPYASYMNNAKAYKKEYRIENIYRDNKLLGTMEAIFDNEQQKELRAGTFNVNLGKEDGLAGIIIDVREAAEYLATYGDLSEGDPNYDAKKKAIIDIFELEVEETTGIISLSADQKMLRKGIKDLVDQKILRYDGATGDYLQLAKIFTRAQRQDLDTFASLVQSKDDITMAVKEWNNALNLTGQNRELEKEDQKESLVHKDNVLAFLCDFDSNGALGDMATIFGDQVLFTINQAVKVIETTQPGMGQKTVIFNIIKNMNISDRRLTKSALFEDMLHNLDSCTTENLSKLINGYQDSEDTYITGMPEFKIFFLDSIKKINGGSDMATPDLYDTLTGDDDIPSSSLEIYYQETGKIKDTIYERLTDPQKKNDPEYASLIQTIEERGIVYVTDNFFTKLMKTINNIDIVLSNGSITNLQAMGIGKSREIDSIRNEALATIIKSLRTGLHYSSAGGLRLTLGMGKNGISESQRTKWSRNAETGVMLNEKMDLYLGLGGEVLEQYNYKQVINADLSEVQKATYLGLEGGAGVGIRKGIELYGGLTREQNAEIGINQIDQQYQEISDRIFDVSFMDSDQLANKDAFQSYIQGRINDLAGKKQRSKFIETNRQHLKDNLGFIVSYMDANGFFGPEGKIAKLPQGSKKEAIRTLVNILQSGNREQRRHDVIMGLQGKVEITKLSFGLTTSAITRGTARNTFSGGTTGNGGTDEPGTYEGDAGTGESEITPAADRFGIAGYYMGIRVSTWVNHYVPQSQQYLYTEMELQHGLGTRKLDIVNDYEKDINGYAAYLQAFYNDPRLNCWAEGGVLKIKFTPDKQNASLKITSFLNIRTTDGAQKNFSYDGDNTLIIGNVGDIGAYTITEAKGIRRVLCLGTKELEKAHKFSTSSQQSVEKIRSSTLTYKERDKSGIDTKIIDQMNGTGLDAEAVKSETKQFFDTQGKLTKPADKTVEYQNCAVGQLFKNGSITITKKTTGTYEVKYISTPADKLTINYIDQGAYETQYNTAINNSANRVERRVDLPQNAFTLPQTITSVFTPSVEQGLSVFDDYEKTLYKDFMKSIVDTNLDSFIDETDYSAAFTILKTILENNANYENYPQLKALIDSNLSTTDKALIVDKFKTIFSYILVLTDGKIDGRDVATTANGRGEYYRTIKGPDDSTPYPLPQSYKTKAVNAIKNEPSLSRKTIENLVGFTAFYRLDGNARKYAMTPIGGTNILQGSNANSMVAIEKQDLAAVQEWFISNLKVNITNTNILLNKINSSIASTGITITESQLPALLRGKAIPLDSGQKISIDIDYVFYLLGECANESLGAKINDIKISEFKEPVDDQGNNTLPGKYTATGVSEKIYEYGASVYSKSHSVASEVQAEEKKFGAKYHQHTDIYDPKGKTNTDAKGGGTSDPGTYFDNETYYGNE